MADRPPGAPGRSGGRRRRLRLPRRSWPAAPRACRPASWWPAGPTISGLNCTATGAATVYEAAPGVDATWEGRVWAGRPDRQGLEPVVPGRNLAGLNAADDMAGRAAAYRRQSLLRVCLCICSCRPSPRLFPSSLSVDGYFCSQDSVEEFSSTIDHSDEERLFPPVRMGRRLFPVSVSSLLCSENLTVFFRFVAVFSFSYAFNPN